MTFRQFRIATLLTLLISVAVLTWWESWSVTQWNRPLEVVIYPIAGSDDAKVAAIQALNPSLADLEDAAICMTGDHDVLAKSGHHVPVTAARIVELLAEDEEEPER